MVHSGLQLGGVPTYVGKHEHEGELPISLHCEYGPQGDGMQGFINAGWGDASGRPRIQVLYVWE